MADTDELSFDEFFTKAVAEGEAPVEQSKAEEPEPAAPAKAEPAAPAKAEPAAPAKAEPAALDVGKLISDTVAATAAAMKPETPVAPVPEDPALVQMNEKLEKFRKDWPEHAEVMDLALKTQQQAMMAEFAKILAPLQGQLTPMAELVESQAQAAHEAEILKVHPDAKDLLPKIEEWVAAKPAYLQGAYNNVLDNGSVAEVNALLAEFKAAQPAAPAAPLVDDKRLKSSEPVQSLRAVTPGVIDPNDFDSAFRAAAAEAQKSL